MVHKMADEYILEMPKISIPDCSPEWVFAFFPALTKSIYDSYNGTIRKIVMDFNASFMEMEQEIQNLSKSTKTANDTVADLKSELSKHLGQHVTGCDAQRWNHGRDKLMKVLVLAKFSQNSTLKERLCDTGTMHLAEATKGDEHFGTRVALTNPSCFIRKIRKALTS